MPDVEDAASIIPKQEDFHEASPASSIDSNGELDAEVETEETVNLLPAIPQKRKGGRKPVRSQLSFSLRSDQEHKLIDFFARYMQLRKKESKETARLKLPSGKDVQNI